MATRSLKQTTLQADRHTASTDASAADITFSGIGVAIFCNVAGDVEVRDLAGNYAVYTMVAGSTINPPLFDMIRDDNSTATVIVMYRQNPQA
jgi:hypothetical protein